MLAIAEELLVQPTWLLLGEGAERLGAPLPDRDMAARLHDHIKGVLAAELRTTPEFVESVLPVAEDLLRDAEERYRAQVGEGVRQQREWKRSQSLLDRALEMTDLTRKQQAAKQQALRAALLEWGTKEDARRRAMPPVDPSLSPDDLGPLGVLGVPPLLPFRPRTT